MTDTKKNIWVVEDDAGLQFVYGEILGFRYNLTFFGTLEKFRAALKERADTSTPDLLIMDLRLPDGSFLDLLMEADSPKLFSMPFLVVSSMDDLDALRICFEEGAIDYITKPFGKSELIVKIERIFLRPPEARVFHREHSNETGAMGQEILLDPVTLTVRRGTLQSSPLTSKEFQILSVLKNAPQNALPRDQIVDRVWQKTKVTGKTLDVHLFNLRKKLVGLRVELVFQPPQSFRLLCDRMDS